ncbi:MAG: hypothetical protein LCH41_04385 [Armatimonadetes bacterium]|nr:hypothetical protein [Armatimonadota bacterium]
MNQRALPYAFGLGTLAALLVIGCSQPAPVAPEPKAKPSPEKSSSRPRAGDYQSSPSKRVPAQAKGSVRPPRQELPPPAPLDSAPSSEGSDLLGQILGQGFRPNHAEILAFKNPDTVTNNGTTDKAQKYHFELIQGTDTFDNTGSMLIIFATDFGVPLSNLSIDWRPTKFGTDEHRAQAYPHDGGVGRGVYGVHLSLGGDVEMVNDEIEARLNFGPEKGGQIPFVLNLKTEKGWVRGKGTAQVVRR